MDERTELCGTPQYKFCPVNSVPQVRQKKVKPMRCYTINTSSEFKLVGRMEWSTVSVAAERPNSINREDYALSNVKQRLFTSATEAVSVPNPGLKPD